MPSYVALPVGPVVWQSIDRRTLTGTTYTSPTWPAGAYRWLKFVARCSASGGNATVTLTGLTGTYDSALDFILAGGVPTAFVQASWTFTFGANATCKGEIFCPSGGPRTIDGSYWHPTGPNRSSLIGSNDDTTHDVTGFVMTLGGSGTFTVTLLGMA